LADGGFVETVVFPCENSLNVAVTREMGARFTKLQPTPSRGQFDMLFDLFVIPRAGPFR
jgi:hypothetical protein